MDLITALAVSISVLGAIAAYLFLSPFGMGLQIWAAFIAWASFFHCGGKEAGLQKTIVHNVFGAIVAWILLLLVTKIPLAGALGLPLWAAICVLITVFVAVYAAKAPMLADIPATVFGFAAVVGYALAGNKLGAVTAMTLENPLFNIAVSMIVGAIFAYVSEKVAGVLVKK
jgi:hypothetical protein